MTRPSKPIARVEAHLEKLRAAGLDTQAFFEALVDIRDDSGLSETHRESLYQIVAMESFIWYLEALNGAPIDRIKAAQEAMKIAEENSVAIKKTTPGEAAAELAKRDISLTQDQPPPDFPQSEVTVRERPPKKRPGPRPAKTVNERPPDQKATPRKKRPTPKAGVTKFERVPKKK